MISKVVDFLVFATIAAAIAACVYMCSALPSDGDGRCNNIAVDELNSGRSTLEVLERHARCVHGEAK